MANQSVYLTTSDNPYDPVDQFQEWYSYDTMKGYDCCGYLARVALLNNGMSEADNDEAIERAIDEIVRLNGGLYKKIVKS